MQERCQTQLIQKAINHFVLRVVQPALVGMIGTPFVHQLFVWLPTISEHSAAADLVDGILRYPVLAGAVRFVNGLPEDPSSSAASADKKKEDGKGG